MKSVYLLVALSVLVAGCSSDSAAPVPLAPNEAPKLAPVSDQTLEANTTSEPIAVSVSDDTTQVGNLVYEVTSNNGFLLPLGSLTSEVTAGGLSLTIRPAPGVIGVATITLTATDAQGLRQSETFNLTVNRQNLAFGELVRSVFVDQASSTPRELDSLIIDQGNSSEDFSDLLL